VIPPSPNETEVQLWKDADLFDAPECPGSYRYFNCTASGFINAVSVTITKQPTNTMFEPNFFGLQVSSAVFDGYVGMLRSVPFIGMLDIRNSVLYDESLFEKFGAPRVNSLTLINVSLPRYIAFDQPVIPALCRFVNVTFVCPISAAFARCFPDSILPPCVNAIVGNSLPPPVVNPYAGRISQLCVTTGGQACYNGSSSEFTYFGGPNSTLEFTRHSPGETEYFAYQSNVTGLVTRIDLYDWRTLKWTTAFSDPVPRRTFADLSRSSFAFVYLPAIFTNKARVTFEQRIPAHVVTLRPPGLSVREWPKTASTQPQRNVDCSNSAIQTFDSRSMLDETIADSFCVGKTCSFACTVTGTQSFDLIAPSAAQFLIVEGPPWTNSSGTLVATTSENTRIYAVNFTVAVENEFVPFTLTDLPQAKRVRLIYSSRDAPFYAPVSLKQKGLPGIFVKRFASALPIGGTKVDQATVITAVTLDEKRLTPLTLNRNETTPARKFVKIGGGRWIVAVAASFKILDNSALPLLVGRSLLQGPLDVFDSKSGLYFNNVLQHDIAQNISAIDILQWNETSFAVVDSISRSASLFEWRAFPFNLTACSNHQRCGSCLTDETNDEACKWCGSRCISRGSANCTAPELATLSPTECDDPTTTSTITTGTTSEAALPTKTTATVSGVELSAPTVDTTVLTAGTASVFEPLSTILCCLLAFAMVSK
jgi:hypothetical protein